MKTFWHIARVLLGLVFVFSGFVKGIDPLGSAYKFSDYFQAWGLDFFSHLAFLSGVLLSAFEFIVGVALLVNVLPSFFSVLALLFMIFFTGLTLVVAIGNPVSDCGCFGDAFKLTNWQTFGKNLFLLALALVFRKYRRFGDGDRYILLKSVFSVITLFAYGYLVSYSYHHLPIIDFRPYKVGTNLAEAVAIPVDAPRDIYENTFIYKQKRTGEEKKFTEEDYPWRDSLNWEFVSMDSRLVKKGYEAPVKNFSIETAEGEDVKDFYLHDPAYTFILSVYDEQKANLSTMDKIRTLASYSEENDIRFIGLTSATPRAADRFKAENGLDFDFFYADDITLKTMIRSNPGLILLRNGVIAGKWHFNDIPEIKEFINQQDYLDRRNS
ncbi:MAG: BT_3928 family protein [Mangrovibacterium sp.]